MAARQDASTTMRVVMSEAEAKKPKRALRNEG
jgi:hypothetical protein